jgi:hypothetical protein
MSGYRCTGCSGRFHCGDIAGYNSLRIEGGLRAECCDDSLSAVVRRVVRELPEGVVTALDFNGGVAHWPPQPGDDPWWLDWANEIVEEHRT